MCQPQSQWVEEGKPDPGTLNSLIRCSRTHPPTPNPCKGLMDVECPAWLASLEKAGVFLQFRHHITAPDGPEVPARLGRPPCETRWIRRRCWAVSAEESARISARIPRLKGKWCFYFLKVSVKNPPGGARGSVMGGD